MLTIDLLTGKEYLLNITSSSGNTGGGGVSYPTFSDLPIIGNVTGLYLVKDTNTFYTWNGSDYVSIDLADVITCYIVGSTPLASDWLSLNVGGAALTPATEKIYIILTAGSYLNTQYRWSGSVYVSIGSGNGGAIETTFSEVLTFNAQWQVRETIMVDDLVYSLAGVGNIPNSFIEDRISGDGVHAVSFPSEWFQSNNTIFDNTKINAIIFYHDKNGVVRYSIETLNSLVLVIPGNINATSNADSITITWDAVTNATSYDIEVSDTGTSGWALRENTANLTSTQSGLVQGDTKYYRVKALDDIGSYIDSAYTEVIAETVSLVPIWYDDFTGTSFDAAWTKVNTNPTIVSITQNNKMILATTSANSTFGQDYISRGGLMSDLVCLTFSISRTATAGTFLAMLYVDMNNRVVISKSTIDSSKAAITVVIGGTSVYSLNSSIPLNNRFKITYEGATNYIRFFYWDNSQWVQIGTTQTYVLSGTKLMEFMVVGVFGGTQTVNITELGYYDNDLIARR